MKKSDYIRISKDRYNHIISVARRMSEIARENCADQDESEDMFILGLLHDCGYEFSKVQSEHNRIGGEILRRNGYKYWQEVYYHGEPNADYSSKELDLLNRVDFLTSPNGSDMTAKERLDDIECRYGKTSIQYIKANDLAMQLKLL